MRTKEFLSVENREGIAILWLDHQAEPENIVSPPIIELLDTAFADFENDEALKAAVLISRKKNFIAGADIRSFEIEQKGDFRPFQELGHRTLDRLQHSEKPVVAAIHGACLGLGTELALACHKRIASDDATTRFALPEVQLGLLPGGGGTQRLPRRIGIQRALDMMLTGRNIYAFQAKKWGLVDDLVHEHKLLQAALREATRLLKNGSRRKKRAQSLRNRLLEGTSAGRALLFGQARKRALKKSQGNYPAIPAILDCVQTGYRKGIQAGFGKELEWFETLMLTDESKSLRALFFMSTEQKKRYAGKGDSIRKIGVVGAGFMGAGIAEISLLKGYDVLIKDIDEARIASARKQVWKALEKKVRYRALSGVDAEQIAGRLQGQLDYEAFGHLDLVIEAVVEDIEVKKSLIDEMQKYLPDNAIIASNTSSLSITEMADHARHPGQVVGMHYFSPVSRMPLLEVIRTKHTSQRVIETCYNVGIQQGKTCILVRDSPGFYVNRILAPYMNEALLMVEEGGRIEDIDDAFVKLGFPVGPLTLFDQVGLDVAAHAVKSSEEIVRGRPGFEVHYGVVQMVEAGRLGKKNATGFYRYDEKRGKRIAPDTSAYAFFGARRRIDLSKDSIQRRGLTLMLNEAVLCLDERIIEGPEDGDLGAVMGLGFLPFTGGPFRYIDQKGAGNMVAIMEDLVETYGPRFTPAGRLKEMAERHANFYGTHR